MLTVWLCGIVLTAWDTVWLLCGIVLTAWQVHDKKSSTTEESKWHTLC